MPSPVHGESFKMNLQDKSVQDEFVTGRRILLVDETSYTNQRLGHFLALARKIFTLFVVKFAPI
jgi:hypothetical protein